MMTVVNKGLNRVIEVSERQVAARNSLYDGNTSYEEYNVMYKGGKRNNIQQAVVEAAVSLERILQVLGWDEHPAVRTYFDFDKAVLDALLQAVDHKIMTSPMELIDYLAPAVSDEEFVEFVRFVDYFATTDSLSWKWHKWVSATQGAA